MRRAYLLMHVAIVLWGLTAILGKLISLDEGLLVWYRMLFSALATGIYLLFSGGIKGIGKKGLMHLGGIGFLITLHWITFYGAIKASNVSIAISCFSSVAVFTAILEPLFSGTRPKIRELLLGVAVTTGIFFIFSDSELRFKGIALSLVSAMLASLFTIFNQRISGKYAAGQIAFFELGTGFLLLSAFLPLWFSINGSTFALPGAHDLIYLLILSVFCTTVAFTISLIALQKIDAFTMNLNVNLEPLYSIILAVLLFQEHEELGPGFYIGSAMILCAVTVHGFIKLRAKKAV